MAILRIVKMGHSGLLKPSRKVTFPLLKSVRGPALSMIQTLENIKAIGLAAPQVGKHLRLFVYAIPKNRIPKGAKQKPIPWTVVINPKIKPIVSRKHPIWERCLSLPGLYGKVPRFPKIRLVFSTLQGETKTVDAAGYHASLIQHEYDHLEGILYPMLLKNLKNFAFSSELKGKKGVYAYSPREFDGV